MDPMQNESGNGPDNKVPDFTPKPVEQPFLSSREKDKLTGSNAAKPPGGFKNFYRANRLYFWAIAAGLVIIGALAFLIFRKPAPTTVKEANVNVTVDTPDTVPSGGEILYKIKIDNQDPSKLISMSLELAYPEGVTYLNSTPPAGNLSGSLFTVPDLVSGQNATVFVKARATGNVNDAKKLTVTLHYKFSNFNSEFTKTADRTVRLVASNILLELSGPVTTNNAQLVMYTVKYGNSADADIKNARIQMDYPDGFNFAQADPRPDMGNNIWNVGNLPKGAQGSIQIQGTFRSASPGESRIATAELQVLGTDGQYYKQNESNFTTAIASLPLLVTQEVRQAGNNPDSAVNPGETLIYDIKYQNNAATAATGVNVTVTLASKALDLATLRAEGGQINNNTITWNESSVSNLGSLLPNESGNLSFSVRVKNPATRDSSKNLDVASSVKIKANEYESFFPGNELNLKISSPASLSSALSFLSGSLPPTVGQATVYKVILSLSNSTNDFTNGTLTAYIPLGAGGFVENSVSGAEAGNASYDASTGKLTWNFGSLPAHTGQFTKAKALEFNVRIIPAAAQANTSPVLVKNISATAKDSFTGQDISISADDLTTSDISGSYGWDSGQVRE
ncbi:MAG: DUF11 domain-containing protein [Patescibacteria group bacterium]|nr:DUF11 domain-containing protein [Patescibacteria group bacterium]